MGAFLISSFLLAVRESESIAAEPNYPKKAIMHSQKAVSYPVQKRPYVRLMSQVCQTSVGCVIGVSHVQLAFLPSPLTTVYIGCLFLHRFNQHTSGTLPFFLSRGFTSYEQQSEVDDDGDGDYSAALCEGLSLRERRAKASAVSRSARVSTGSESPVAVVDTIFLSLGTHCHLYLSRGDSLALFHDYRYT
jgi:hypothetical protein